MFVLDNSVLIAGLFDDEKQRESLAIVEALLLGEESAVVPPIFRYEATNAVLVAYRRKRISAKSKADYLDVITRLPLMQDAMPDINAVVSLASKHALSTYDASYLELALRSSIPLATYDEALKRAAHKEDVALVFLP